MNSIKNDLPPNFLPANSAPPKNDGSLKDKRDPKMVEAAQGFENQFVRQMITEMRKTVPKDDVVPETMADGIFKDQLDDNYAEQWVKQGGIGLTDMIYDQLDQKYGHHEKTKVPLKGEFIGLKEKGAPAAVGTAVGTDLLPPNSGPPAVLGESKSVPNPVPNPPQDIFTKADKDLFMVKRTEKGFEIKSREPLPEHVSVRAPLSGIVLQAATLPDGRQAIVLEHDQGLVSQFIHTGKNKVQTNTRIAAGEVIADLPASKNGEFSRVFFGLRKASKLE